MCGEKAEATSAPPVLRGLSAAKPGGRAISRRRRTPAWPDRQKARVPLQSVRGGGSRSDSGTDAGAPARNRAAPRQHTAEAEPGAGRQGCCAARATVAEPAEASAAEATQGPGGGGGRSGKKRTQGIWLCAAGAGSRSELTSKADWRRIRRSVAPQKRAPEPWSWSGEEGPGLPRERRRCGTKAGSTKGNAVKSSRPLNPELDSPARPRRVEGRRSGAKVNPGRRVAGAAAVSRKAAGPAGSWRPGWACDLPIDD